MAGTQHEKGGKMAYSNDTLMRLLREGGMIKVPYFGDEEIRLECQDVDPATALPALKNFLQLTPAQRQRDARHLHAYYLMMNDACGNNMLDHLTDEIVGEADIWRYASPSLVYFSQIYVEAYADLETVFVEIEGNCEWEEEHGLQMCWENGSKLVKVSAYDGHPTNGHAYANTEKDKYIFACFDERFATYPDE